MTNRIGARKTSREESFISVSKHDGMTEGISVRTSSEQHPGYKSFSYKDTVDVFDPSDPSYLEDNESKGFNSNHQSTFGSSKQKPLKFSIRDKLEQPIVSPPNLS